MINNEDMRIQLVDSMGGDTSIANAARNSFGKKAANYTAAQNEKLVKYLAREGHIIPFGHVQITCSIQAPIFLMRQIMRSNVGVVYSEISRRYVDYTPAVWKPLEWRERPAKGIKQGSGDSLSNQEEANSLYQKAARQALEDYDTLLEKGVAPEQARAVLPQGMYTSVIATGSLLYWSRVYNLRAGHIGLPQRELRSLMIQLNNICMDVAPVSWHSLIGGDDG